MWRIDAADGRTAWYCGDDDAGLREMVAELFADVETSVTEVEDRP